MGMHSEPHSGLHSVSRTDKSWASHSEWQKVRQMVASSVDPTARKSERHWEPLKEPRWVHPSDENWGPQWVDHSARRSEPHSAPHSEFSLVDPSEVNWARHSDLHSGRYSGVQTDSLLAPRWGSAKVHQTAAQTAGKTDTHSAHPMVQSLDKTTAHHSG